MRLTLGNALSIGYAEGLIAQGNQMGEMARVGIGYGIKYGRNGFYLGVALAVIACLSSFFLPQTLVMVHSCRVLAGLGTLFSLFSLYRVYKHTLLLNASI